MKIPDTPTNWEERFREFLHGTVDEGIHIPRTEEELIAFIASEKSLSERQGAERAWRAGYLSGQSREEPGNAYEKFLRTQEVEGESGILVSRNHTEV